MIFGDAGRGALMRGLAQQQGGGQQPGLLDRFEQQMQNPLVAAAMGAGGAMLGSQGGLGQAIQAGVMGGAGGAFGAARMNRQAEQNKKREHMMRKILDGYENVASNGQLQPLFGRQRQGPAQDPMAAYQQLQRMYG